MKKSVVIMTAKKSLILAAVLVFIISFFFFDFLLEGLPFHYGEDTDMLHVALETPWTTMFALSLNPFSHHLYQFGEKTFLTTRPFETLVFKVMGSLYGFRAAPLYRIKALFAGGVCVGLFLMLFGATSSLLISLLAWFFFLTAPALFASVRYIHDYEIVSQCFLLAAFYLFGRLGDERAPPYKIMGLALGVLFLGTLALRTKEPAKILPLTLFLFLMLRHSGNPFKEFKSSRGWVRMFLVVFFASAVFFPFIGKTHDVRGRLSLYPMNLYSFLIQNAFGYEMEKRIALFTTENTLPGSYLGTFGFFLGWAFLLILFLALFQRRRVALAPSFDPIFKFSLAWWISALLGYLLIHRLDDRFLAVSLTPAVIVSFSGLHYALVKIKGGSSRLSVFTQGFFIFLLLINAQRNLDHIVFSRNFHGGWLVAEDKIFRAVTEDRFPGQPALEPQMDRYLKEQIPKEVLVELRPPNGLEREVDWAALETLKRSLPYLYVASIEEVPSNHPDWELLTTVSSLSESFYGRFIKKVKKKSSKTVYLYKWERPNGSPV